MDNIRETFKNSLINNSSLWCICIGRNRKLWQKWKNKQLPHITVLIMSLVLFTFFALWWSWRTITGSSHWRALQGPKDNINNITYIKKIKKINGSKTFIKEYNKATFDIEITASKFIELFLAVNKSSLHPEISSCIRLKALTW